MTEDLNFRINDIKEAYKYYLYAFNGKEVDYKFKVHSMDGLLKRLSYLKNFLESEGLKGHKLKNKEKECQIIALKNLKEEIILKEEDEILREMIIPQIDIWIYHLDK